MLKPGGIYVIEDWGTGYWEDWPDGEEFRPSAKHLIYRLRRQYIQDKEYENPKRINYESHGVGMVGFVKQLVDEVSIEDIKHSNRDLKDFYTDILGVFYSMGQVFIFKK